MAELAAASSFASDIGPIGVISPHMDDAALSCGRLLSARPGSHVFTIFSGGPASVRPLPTWDQMSGSFKPGDNVMALRQVEDEDAMAVVAAHGHRLDFWDEQYRAGRPIRLARLRPRALSAARARLDDPALESSVEQRLHGIVAEMALETWLIPLGLWHGDHKMAARACLRVARRRPERRWVVYEELPYRLEVPLEVTAAKQRIQANGFGIRPNDFASSGDTSKKRDMVNAYRSQIPCLGNRADIAVDNPEVFHILSSQPSDGDPSPVAGAPAPRAR
ncbi:MAG: PIG-L family deacetylase [Acidimicrobiales bacterium]